MAMKRSPRLINNPTGPMPKILLKFVGFFSIFGVSSKMLLATLIASQQSASSASTESDWLDISFDPPHIYALPPFLKHCSGPISAIRSRWWSRSGWTWRNRSRRRHFGRSSHSQHPFSSDYIESAGLFCDSLAAFINALKYSASPVLNNPYHASNSGGA